MSLVLTKPEDLHPHTTSHRCHLYLTDGMVRYLSDCTHSLSGKTVPVEPPCFGADVTSEG